ncbi:MAG: hypothetical protein SVX38_16615, partial [Chloroflexota bacterium]|nr:hypothetical protein [Chloroflexota bacterium]
RTSPVVWLGLLAACPLLLRRGVANRDSRFPLFVLLCFVALFVISMTPPVKKFDRYLVPVFPALDLVAAAGIVWIAERVSRWRRGGAPLVLTAAVVLQALVSLPYMPYFLAYQNPLLGGAKAAAEVLPIGWGEGVNQAASYLNGLEGAEHLRVVAWAMPHFAPLFVGEALPLDETNLLLADYLVIGIGDVQGLAVEVEPLLAEAELVHTVRLGNLDYVYVYANTAYRLAETYIADQARPGDVIVLDAVGQRYDVGLPLHVFAATDDAATVARRLKELTQGRQRLWYVSYPQASPILRKYVAGQLAAEAELISQEKVGAVTVTLYSLPAEVTFVAPAQEFEADFGGQLALVDHVLLTPAVAYPGKVRLVLRWRALAPMTDDYTVFVNLLDQDGRLRGAGGGGALLVDGAFFPTSAWEAGDTAEVEVGLSLEGGLPPGPYQVTVVVSKPDQSGRLAVFDAQGSSAGTAHRVAEVELQPAREQPSLEELLISHRLSQVWDEELELLGYNLAHRVDAGGTVSLGLFWHGRAHMERDYELSVRLQAADGEVAWETVLPLCPYPTGRWSAGAVFHV